jgi:hypothetical protein
MDKNKVQTPGFNFIVHGFYPAMLNNGYLDQVTEIVDFSKNSPANVYKRNAFIVFYEALRKNCYCCYSKLSQML